MRNLIWRCLGAAFFMSVALAHAAPANKVTVITGAGNTVSVKRNKTNSSTQVTVTLNPQDTVTLNPPVISPPIEWTGLANEGAAFTLTGPQIVRYGVGTKWTAKVLSGDGVCSNAFFGVDPLIGSAKTCQLKGGETLVLPAVIPEPPPPNPPPTEPDHHAGLVVDLSGLPAFQPGISTPLLSAPAALAPAPAAGDWEHDGKFRILCNVAKVTYDDPIVYPGMPGAAHPHIFFGNTGIDAFTTTDNIRSKGNATCRGGTINMSGYWVPLMIDTATNKPVLPKANLGYYATGFWPYMNDGSVMQPLPKGLKMIAGDAKATGPVNPGDFTCMVTATGSGVPGLQNLKTIPTCTSGNEMWARLPFPQCWDGVNLDSPDHRSHMAYPVTSTLPSATGERPYRCPATHPVVIPAISYHIEYVVPANPQEMAKWRLSSDVYDPALPPGYSWHGDWMNGWDQALSDDWGIKCLRERRNCGSAQLGDGRTTLEFQGN